MLCSFVDQPERVTPAQMDRWARDFANWGICDTICFHLFDRTPHAWKKPGPWSGRREEFVKRVIGLPGDRISFRGGRVFVNGEPIEGKPTGETFQDEAGNALQVSDVTLGDRRFQTLDDPSVTLAGPPESIVVEPGRYFMLGDNRDHSKDSRFWGTVRLAEIKGPAFILYWSWDFVGGWLELLNPITWIDNLANKTRWERFGTMVGCLPPREEAAAD